MDKLRSLALASILLAGLVACGGQQLETPLVISEVLAGVTGDNNYEFIELYNTTSEPIDLQGFSLVYYLSSESEGFLVQSWSESWLIPPQGHFLLVRAGADVGVAPDIDFEQPLNTTSGGLALLDEDGMVVDRLGWGEVSELAEGRSASSLENDVSLQRKPGGDEGNGIDTDNNRSDFELSDTPTPQNIGSSPTPFEAERLVLSANGPTAAEPVSLFDYVLVLDNETGTNVHNVELSFTVPPSLTVTTASDDGQVDGQAILWSLDTLAAGETVERSVTVETPVTYVSLVAHQWIAQAADWPRPAIAAPVRTRVEGGVIPIGTARTLLGTNVTVAGIATMYTGGYYAGTNNAKFYIQDTTGGIQIQCFDEDGTPPTIAIGDRVQVTGEVGIYRNSMQIVPNDNVADVVVLEQVEPLAAQEITVQQALDDPAFVGQYVSATGQAIRIEEFTYSYEIDLADDTGNVLLVYVDKLALLDLAVEGMDVGHQYTVAGVAEMYDDLLQLKPRTADDLLEVFPPVLAVSGDTLVNVPPGAALPYTLTVYNHTDAPFTNVVVTSSLPADNAILASVSDRGLVEENLLFWNIPSLAARQSVNVRFAVTVTGETGAVEVSSYGAVADEWPTPATDLPLLTFIGDIAPIYAIQGPGAASPYKLEYVETEGTVTSIFPELGGFWLQSTEPDDDPTTSEGLFVYAGEHAVELEPTDIVRVYGRVRERGSQTELHITSPDDVESLDIQQSLPDPISIDPPADAPEALAYYEPLEGMLVELAEPAVAVGPVNRYGEYALVLAEYGIERVLHGDETGQLIRVDDGSQVAHGDGSTLPYLVTTGDQIEDLSGPLAFTFGNFKIEPLDPPTITSAPSGPSPQIPEPGGNEFSFATFNMENLFDANEPHPVSDPPRPSRGAYEWRLDQIAQAILSMGTPTFIGAQEVENIDVLEDLAAHSDLEGYGYQAILIEGGSSRGIDVGFLVRSDRVTVTGIGQHQAPGDLFSRPPLMITATVSTESAGEITLYAIVNHLISKSGGEALTEPRRVLEVEWNVTLVDRILANDPEAFVVVLGDLNDYYDSVPLAAITAGETPGSQLVNTMQGADREQRYSFIYQGVSQLLDHILVTPSLAEHLVQAEALHINADYPLPIPETAGRYRCSDHDPVVALFSFGD
jgi:predicted extracellular nuclease